MPYNAGSSTTPNPTYTIECEYADHPTNSTELCELWCQIEAYKGGFCLKTDECPYVLMDPVLCSLWEEIQLGRNKLPYQFYFTCIFFVANTSTSGSTPSSSLGSLLGPAVGSNGQIAYSECPYISESYSFLACELWCQLREISSVAETCTGFG